MFRIYRDKPAFTIVELLVVIVVIGILAAITIVSYTGLSSKATVASLQSDLSSAKKQLALYQVENSVFPTSMPLSNGRYCPNGSEDSKYCIKPSSDTTFTYSANNSNATPTFNLLATKGSTNYNVTNSSQPSLVTPAVATGGNNVTTDGRYRVHTFTSSGTLTVTTQGTAEVLVVGGGGGGGSRASGGGGGGGYLNEIVTLTDSMAITIGEGGLSSPYNNDGSGCTDGGDTIAFGLTAHGGGRGNYGGGQGGSGGSGGGGGWSGGAGGIATPSGQGNNGGTGNSGGNPYYYLGGGGGGAGGVGNTVAVDSHVVGTAGIGMSSKITGSNVTYSSGGLGGDWSISQTGVSGLANTGTGGGSGSGTGYNGGSGGSGIVVIRYLIP